MPHKHYIAIGTRTLCGSLLHRANQQHPLWADFLAAYERRDANLCRKCLKAAKRFQRFALDLAAVDRKLRARGPDAEP